MLQYTFTSFLLLLLQISSLEEHKFIICSFCRWEVWVIAQEIQEAELKALVELGSFLEDLEINSCSALFRYQQNCSLQLQNWVHISFLDGNSF